TGKSTFHPCAGKRFAYSTRACTKLRIAMTQELSGRVAIVTGAGRNIGRAIALALADGGATVVVNARSNLQEAEAVAAEIGRGGREALAVTPHVAHAGPG